MSSKRSQTEAKPVTSPPAELIEPTAEQLDAVLREHGSSYKELLAQAAAEFGLPPQEVSQRDLEKFLTHLWLRRQANKVGTGFFFGRRLKLGDAEAADSRMAEETIPIQGLSQAQMVRVVFETLLAQAARDHLEQIDGKTLKTAAAHSIPKVSRQTQIDQLADAPRFVQFRQLFL